MMVRAFGTSGRPCFFFFSLAIRIKGLDSMAQASGRSYLGDSDGLGYGAS